MEKKEENSDRIEQKKQEALKISIEEGAATRVAYGLGTNYITPFALALKASSTQIGIINSLTGLLPQIAQTFGSRLLETNSRKKVVLKAVKLEIFFWILLALLGFLAYYGLVSAISIYALIIIYTTLTISSGIGYPAWFSWMGDLMPQKQRGKYLSKRNIAAGIVEIATLLLGIALIRAFEKGDMLLMGLGIFFIVSASFKFVSYRLLEKQYEPEFRLKKELDFSFLQFVKKYDNFGKFAVYQGFFYFSIMVASPFFIVYMAKSLNLSTFVYMSIMLSSSIFSLLFLPLIGRFSDKYGNVKLLWLSAACFTISPLLWLVSTDPFWLATVPQISSALANSSLVIAFSNFCYASSTPQHRAKCISYSNVLIGLGTFFGAIVGGLILDNLIVEGINIFLGVFVLSSLLRALTAIYFLPKIKDQGKVSEPHLTINLSQPIKTLHSEIGWINEIGKRNYTQGLKVWKAS